MNDRELALLREMMHSASACILGAHDFLHDPVHSKNQEASEMAKKQYNENTLKIALLVDQHVTEMINRRHKAENFSDPFKL